PELGCKQHKRCCPRFAAAILSVRVGMLRIPDGESLSLPFREDEFFHHVPFRIQTSISSANTERGKSNLNTCMSNSDLPTACPAYPVSSVDSVHWNHHNGTRVPDGLAL